MLHRERVRDKPLPILLGAAGIAVLVGVFSLGFEQPVHDPTYGGTWYPQGTPVDGDTNMAVRPSSSPSPYRMATGESSAVYLDSAGSQVAGQSTLEEALVLQDRDTDAAYASPASGSGTIGLAAGGAQDIDNFRKNIENNFLPLYTDITYEGLFYDYYFDTANTQNCEKLFCPSYSSAVSRDPFSDADEYYLSVGLNSGMKESDFERKKLNLVLVLDVSGSMGSPFNRYHYDQFGNTATRGESGDGYTKSKMYVASESIAGLLDHLGDDDRLGVVLFDDSAHMAKPLESMAETNRDALRQHVMEIYANGGTNMASGIRLGTALFENVLESDQFEYENRIIFLTDAMPNTGETRHGGLLDMIRKNAEKSIYTTVIGIGVDFNTELVEHITKVRGANYYAVHSSSDFEERMGEEFEFMVTPLVFDLTLYLESDGYEIRSVYGSPESAQATGQIMKINTLFPSKVSDGQTRGGIVLIKLEKQSDDATISLTTSYENRVGQKDGDTVTVTFGDGSHHFQDSGIRKGVLLTRYADLMQTWAYDERNLLAHGVTPQPAYLFEDGIRVPGYVDNSLGRWERQSVPLGVSVEYGDVISDFNKYFQEELVKIGDFGLLQEVTLMQKLESLT